MTFAVVNLYEANKNVSFKVEYLPDIGLLQSLGLRVGSKVTVRSRYAFGGPVLLRVEDAFSVAIGKDIATQVALKEIAAS